MYLVLKLPRQEFLSRWATVLIIFFFEDLCCTFFKNEETSVFFKHPFLLALRRWGRFARRNVCDPATEVHPRETSPAAKSEEKRMFLQAIF